MKLWKTFLIRIGILVLMMIIIYIPLRNRIIRLQEENFKPVHFTFHQTDIPDQTKKSYGLKEPIQIDHVIITGDFNSWDPVDLNYQMEEVSNGFWQIDLQLNEGLNAYKYVIHIGNPEQHDLPEWSEWEGIHIVWVEDINAEQFEDDNYGGLNSIANIENYGYQLTILNSVFVLIVISILTWIILEGLINIFMRLKLSLRFKLIFTFIMMILISNMIFIYIGSIQINHTIVHSQTDKINLIHNMLLKDGIDFGNLENPAGISNIGVSLSNLYRNMRPRYNYDTFANNIDTTIEIDILDTNGNVLVGQIDQATFGYIITYWDSIEQYDQYNRAWIKALFSTYTNHFISATRSIYYHHEYIDYRNLPTLPTNFTIIAPSTSYETSAWKYFLAGINPFTYIYSSYLNPIYNNNQLVGYYLTFIALEPFHLLKKQFMLFNLIILIVFMVIYTFINSQIGKFILEPLHKLIEWTQAIIRKDFSMEKKIRTNDEVETLAVNFNSMRLSLKKSIDYLSLTSVIAANFQKITDTDELFYFFLGFVTSEFGFRFNRSAIFIQQDDKMIGTYAIGLMDKAEASEVFGSVENYYDANIKLDDYLREYHTGRKNFDSRFTCAVLGLELDLNAPSVIFDIYRTAESEIMRIDQIPHHPQDDKLIESFDFKEIAVFTLYKGNDKIGMLIVDNAIGQHPITEEEMEHLKPVIQYFGTALERTDLFEHMELTIETRTHELQESNAVLNMRNQEIMQSIHYARTIQLSILPPEELIRTHLKKSFVIWKPRDVVGGDFYYLKETYNGFILTVADCTGHSVPGAFMTMTAHSVLNRIIEDIHQDDPAVILRIYNRYMRSALNQDTETALSDDGLDAGICIYNMKTGKLQYAGAKIDLWQFRNGEVNEYKGDRQSIGYHNSDPDYEFKVSSVSVSEGDRFYLSSDGFYHQIGGERHMPFGKKRLVELIASTADEELSAQSEHLREAFDNWKGDEPQRDDITVWGFRT